MSCVLVFFTCSTGCEAPEPACEVRVTQTALVNGTERAAFLALEPWEERALVHVQDEAGSLAVAQCSGILVAERLVMTAKHCLRHGPSALLRVSFEDGDASVFETGATAVASHPREDLSLVELWETPRDVVDVSPLPLALAPPPRFAPGSLVQIGGSGLDEQGLGGRRGFMVGEVRELTPEAIVVSAAELGGACFGDSGGPLLVRDDSGRVAVLGLLSAGAVSCRGNDSYTRVDVLRAWVLAHGGAGGPQVPPRQYSSLGREGRCFEGRAIWNEEGGLRVSLCTANEVCGWDEGAVAHRCIAAAVDPCAGVDELGRCDRGSALRCSAGRLVRNPCSSCGFACERSPRTGRSTCLAFAP